MDITYRDAQKQDCPRIAEYIYYASDGILDFLFESVLGGMTVPQILTHGLENEDRYESYKSVTVAEYGPDIVGIVQAYPSVHHRIDDGMRSFFSAKKLELFREFYESRVEDSLQINAMFGDERFRRRGIGTRMIALAGERAKSLALDKLSLFVLADNLNAQKVYRANGFKTIKEIGLEDAAGPSRGRRVYLMSRHI